MKKLIATFAFLLCAHGSTASIAHVTNDKNAYNGGNANGLTITPDNSVTAGNLGVVVARVGPSSRTLTISSNRGTWQTDVSTAGANTGVRLYIFTTVFSSSGAETVTLDADGTDSVHIFGAFAEFSGITGSAWLDKTAVNPDGNFSSSLSSGNTAATSQANELLIGAGATAVDTTFTAGASYALFSNTGSTRLGAEWRIVSSTGAYSATFTTANQSWWTAAIATYKQAAGAPSAARRRIINP